MNLERASWSTAKMRLGLSVNHANALMGPTKSNGANTTGTAPKFGAIFYGRGHSLSQCLRPYLHFHVSSLGYYQYCCAIIYTINRVPSL